jgi:hypothetical protein
VPTRETSEQRKRGTKSGSQKRASASEELGRQEYAPARESLAEILERFLAAGFSEREAQSLICRALTDQKIRCRWRAISDDEVLAQLPPTTADRIRVGLRDNPAAWRGQMEHLYPRHLMGETLPLASPPEPDDLDWRESCFKESQDFGSIGAPQRRSVWVEILQSDVTALISDRRWLIENQKKVADDAETRRQVQKIHEWRENRIRRFTERQRSRRDWINFAEIAEWCSELGGSIVSDEDSRASAYDKLQADFIAGDFEEAGRARVLFLHPWTKTAKMTRDRALEFVELMPPETLRSEYWDHCWIPRHLFRRWLAKHNLPQAPSRFEPSIATSGGSSATSEHVTSSHGMRTKRGRRGPAPGTLDRFGEADRALYRELKRIVRAGKSVNAAATELAEAGKVKGSGTDASRAKRLATRFIKERGSTSAR